MFSLAIKMRTKRAFIVYAAIVMMISLNFISVELWKFFSFVTIVTTYGLYAWYMRRDITFGWSDRMAAKLVRVGDELAYIDLNQLDKPVTEAVQKGRVVAMLGTSPGLDLTYYKRYIRDAYLSILNKELNFVEIETTDNHKVVLPLWYCIDLLDGDE